MPNWVYNSVTITGDNELVEQVRDILAKPYTTFHNDFVKNEETGEFERKPVEWVHDQPFAFWNIQSPTNLDAYYGEETKTDLNNFAESYAKNLAESNHWYEWNVRNWGCKWDASNVELEEPFEANGKLTIGYRFETPWSPPLEAIAKLAHQYPDLIVSIEYEEEQGWGGNWTFEGDLISYKEEWDIPDSHTENMARKDYCWACDDMDEEDWYDDCPRPDLTATEENGNVVL